MTEPPLAFRIVNWIAIIDQLASTEANRVLRPLGLQLPQFVMLNHFSHRPDEPILRLKVVLIGVSGYYTAVSMTLNVAQVMPPDGAPLPLKPLNGRGE